MGRVLGVVVVLMVIAVHLAPVLSEAKESQGSCSKGGGSCVDDASSGKDRHARLTGDRKRSHVGNSGKTMKKQEHQVGGNKKGKVRSQKENVKEKNRGKGKQNKGKKSKTKKKNKKQKRDKNRRTNPKDKHQEKRSLYKNKTQREKTEETPRDTKGKNAEKTKNVKSKDETKNQEENQENIPKTTEEILLEEADIKENDPAHGNEGVTDVKESAPLTLPSNPEDIGEWDTIPGVNEVNEDNSDTNHENKLYIPDLMSVDMEFDSAEMDTGPVVLMEETSEQEDNEGDKRTLDDEEKQDTQEDKVEKKGNEENDNESKIEEEKKRTSRDTEVKDEADTLQDTNGNVSETGNETGENEEQEKKENAAEENIEGEKMDVEENGEERGNEARYLPPVTTEADSSMMQEEISQSK